MSVACSNIHKNLLKRNLLKRRDADHLQNFPERLGQVHSLLGDRHQEKGGHGGPYLDPYTVWRGTEKSAQAQVLFDPAEEQLDGPASAIDQRNYQGIEIECTAVP